MTHRLRFCTIVRGSLLLGPAMIVMGPARAQSDAVPVTAASSATPAADGTPLFPTGSAGQTAGGNAIPPPIAAPSGLLPATGASVRTGSLHDALASGFLGPPLQPATRSWTITPSIGLGEEYTDNVLGQTGSGSGADFITLFQPGIDVSGDTARLQGSLSYHPEIDVYARHSRYTQVAQNFGGQVLGVLLPGTLFLDARGYGSSNSNGIGGTGGTAATTADGSTQTIDVSISPYALRRFGPWGTGEIGANVSRTTLGSLDGGSGSDADRGTGYGLGGFGAPTDQNVTSYSGHAAFETGEQFGRYSGTALGYATKYDGSGVLNNAVRDTATIDGGYGLTRLVTALVRIGYEHIRYAGSDPVRIDDEIWNAGLRLTLGPDSTIEASYGHHDGLDAASVDAALAPTARSRLFVRYSEGLSTEAEQLQNALASSDFDQIGSPIDHSSGAPLLDTAGYFGAQDNLYRSRVLSVTGELILPRDTISLGVNAESNDLVSSGGLPGSLGSNKGIYGNADWSHELSPTLSLSVYGQYGVLDNEDLSGEEDVGTASIALIKALTPTLSGQIRYSYDRRSGDGAVDPEESQNVILLSAQKSF